MTGQEAGAGVPIRGIAKTILYATSSIALFLVIHLTTDNLNRLLRRAARSSTFDFVASYSDTIRSYAPSVKAFIFLCVLAVLCLPILLDAYRRLKEVTPSRLALNLLSTFVIVLSIAILVFRPGVDSMGTNYALIADSPFTQRSSFHNTKLLMPAIAYFLGLRDFTSYYAFSAVLTTIFIGLLYSWIRENTQLRVWQIISLCTCSFVVYQYQYGGYPDILVFISYILVMQNFMSPESKLLLLILAIPAHESSILVGAVLAWRYLSNRQFLTYLAAASTYFLVWFLVSGGDVNTVLASRNVERLSGLEWVVLNPLKEILGVLVAYKAIWLALALSLWILIQKRACKEAVFILACIGAGILMTFLGIDTSRLVGFSFPGALSALSVISHRGTGGTHRALSAIFLVNLILPSFYIGLNGNVEFFPGLYGFLYGAWLSL